MKTKANRILLLLLAASLILNLTQAYFSSLRKSEKSPDSIDMFGTYVNEEESLILLLAPDDEKSGIKKFTLETYGTEGIDIKDSGSYDEETKEIHKLLGDNSHYCLIRRDSGTVELLDIVRDTCVIFEKKDDTVIYGAVPEGVRIPISRS